MKITTILHWIMKILEKILVIFGVALFLCFMFVQFNVPQYWINEIFKDKFPNTDIRVQDITGFFPFSFHVKSILVHHRLHGTATFSDAGVFFNWKNFKFWIDINQAKLTPLKNDEQYTEPKNDALQLTSQNIFTWCQKQVDFLQFIYSVQIKNCHFPNNNFSGVVCLTQNIQRPFLEVRGQWNQHPIKIQCSDLRLNPRHMHIHFTGTYQNQFNLEGNALLVDQNFTVSLESEPFKNFPAGQISLSMRTDKFMRLLDIAQRSNSQLKHEEVAEFIYKTCTVCIQAKMNDDGYISVDVLRKKPIAFVASYMNSSNSLIHKIVERQDEKIGQGDLWILPDHALKFDLSYFIKTHLVNLLQKEQFLPEYIRCQGTLNKDQFVTSVTGVVGQLPVKLNQAVTWNFKEKKLSAVDGKIGIHRFHISPIEWRNGQSSDFYIEPFLLTSQEDSNAIFWGAYGIKGNLILKQDNNFQITASLCSDNNKPSFPKNVTVQNFVPKLTGTLFVAPHHIAFQNFCLTRGKETLHFDLNLFPKKIKDLTKAWKALLTGKQILTDQESLVPIYGKLKGTMNLDVLAPLFWNGDIIKGQFTADLTFSHYLRHPKMQGIFEIKKGYYENIGNGVVLKNIMLNAKGSDSDLCIESLRFTDGTSIGFKSMTQSPQFDVTHPPQGTAGGRGCIHFLNEDKKWDPRFDVDVNCQFLQVVMTDVVKARATGNISLKGPLHGSSVIPVITGDITLNPGHINIEAALDDIPVFDIQVKEKNTPKKVILSSVNPNRFKLDILLRTGKDVVVTGSNKLKCFLKGQMKACGPLREPYLEGTIAFDDQKENTYNLFGHLMKAQSGTVKYDPLLPNIPYVNVTMLTTVKDATIFANVYGYTTHLNYDLKSTPPLSNETILSLLLFKQDMGELTVDQKEQVQSFSSQMLQDNPLGFLDKFRHSVGLDSLEVVEKQDLYSGESTQSIRLGKQLKNMRVYIDQNVSSKANSRMIVSYAITPQLGFQASVSTEKTQSGVGLQWSKRY